MFFLDKGDFFNMIYRIIRYCQDYIIGGITVNRENHGLKVLYKI